MDSKRKILKHMIGKRIKTASKLKISLKRKLKLQEIKRALEIKCYTTQQLNKNTPKLVIPHDVIPIALKRMILDILRNQLELDNS